MKRSLKRVVAMICALAMVVGIFGIPNSEVVKAADDLQSEWSFVSEDASFSYNNEALYWHKVTDANITLNGKDESSYILYMKFYLKDETAVASMKQNTVEVANRGDGKGEIDWLLSDQTFEIGTNELRLKFASGVPKDTTGEVAFSVKETITYFRIFNNSNYDCSGVLLNEVKIIDLTPVVKEYTGATATVEPEAVSGYKFAGWYTDEECTKVLSGETTGKAYAKFVNEDVLGVKTQYVAERPRPTADMIADCDSVLSWVETYKGGSVTQKTGEFVEGTGAIKAIGNGMNKLAMTFKEGYEVDISNYKKLHLRVHINDTDNFGTGSAYFKVRIGSEGSTGAVETLMKPISSLTDGWNTIELDLPTSDSVDLSKVNYIWVYRDAASTTGDSEALEIIIDDIRATNERTKTILDCDSTTADDIDTSTSVLATVTNTAGEFVEGSGAFKSTNTQWLLRTKFKTGCEKDISNYDKISFSLFVNDTTKFNAKTITVGLASGGIHDNGELRIPVQVSELKSNQWNEITVDLKEGRQTNSTGTYNPASINYIRMFVNTASDSGIVTIVDNIRVIKDTSGLIIDCDSATPAYVNSSGVLAKVTTDNAVEGGAYKANHNQIIFRMTLTETKDISNYKKVHFWLYIDDISSYTSDTLRVAFSSSGSSTNEARINYAMSGLQPGWNEIELNLPSKSETYDPANINYIRMYLVNAKAEGTIIGLMVDDICVTQDKTGLIVDCDSATPAYVNSSGVLAKVTTDNVVEGTGAYKANHNQIIFRMTLTETKDISNYKKVHFWLYIDDISSYTSDTLRVAFSSSGSSTNEARINYAMGELQTGWNEIELDLPSKSETYDPAKVNYIRMYLVTAKAEGTIIGLTVDDIRGITENTSAQKKADIRFVTTVDSLNYKNVGFDITIGTKTREMSSNQVYSTLYGIADGEELTYKPDVFAIQSTYFKTHTLTNIPESAFDTEITVQPFWTTQDGTKVSGTAETYTINGEIAKDGVETVETDLRVVMSSDIHYTALVECYNGKSQEAADARMQHWVDQVIAEHKKEPIDLLVINGDLSLDYWGSDSLTSWYEGLVDSENNMTEAFIGTYLEQVKEAGIAVWVMPGNHESYTDDVWEGLTGNARQGSMVVDNNLFIFLDNFNSNLGTDTTVDSTYTATNITTAIQEAMDANPNLDIYLIAHYFDTSSDTNLQTLLTGAYGNRIKGLFAGHNHRATVSKLGANWGNKTIAQTGNFSYAFEGDTTFWGFRELIITDEVAYSQYISVDGIAEDTSTASYTRAVTDIAWY